MEKKIAVRPQPEDVLPLNIAAVVTGKAHPKDLSDAELELSINFLHRVNPARIIVTDRCVVELHKRRNPNAAAVVAQVEKKLDAKAAQA